MNALKHQHVTTTNTHPAIFKDAFGSAKIGRFMSWVFFICTKKFSTKAVWSEFLDGENYIERKTVLCFKARRAFIFNL